MQCGWALRHNANLCVEQPEMCELKCTGRCARRRRPSHAVSALACACLACFVAARCMRLARA
eukprot:4134942-Prymnesium_polylepis.1